MSGTGNGARRGVTLPEMLVTVAILATAAGMSWSAIQTYGRRLAARSDARVFVLALRDARERAMLGGLTETVRARSAAAGPDRVSFRADGTATRALIAFGDQSQFKVRVDEAGAIAITTEP